MKYKFCKSRCIRIILSFLFFILIFITLGNYIAEENSILTFNSGLSSAHWIGTQKISIAHDSLFYKDNPAPIFRKEFNLNGEIENAVLSITSAGYHYV